MSANTRLHLATITTHGYSAANQENEMTANTVNTLLQAHRDQLQDALDGALSAIELARTVLRNDLYKTRVRNTLVILDDALDDYGSFYSGE